MGLFGWIYYVLMGLLFFIILNFLERKYQITKLEKFIISIILLILAAGFCFKFALNWVDDIFLIFVFLLIFDVLYSSYFIDRDFFDKSEKNIRYYILLIIVGFFINQEFINKVTQIFLTGEELRLVIWFGTFVFLYNFCKNKNILYKNNITKTTFMSKENILMNYTKLKYKYDGSFKCDNKDIITIIYAIMIFENSRRGKLLRDYDYFMFKLNGRKRKLGIMQVDSSKFISDVESIEIVCKKLEKLMVKNSKTKSKSNISNVVSSYDKKNSDYINYIVDIIENF